jgi:hypothetical protein
MTRITGGGTEEMRALAVKLRTADPKLKAGLRKRLRASAKPVVARVRVSIGEMPSHHDGTLRREVARTVSAQVGVTKNGIRLDIVSRGARMPAGKDTLPKHLDSARGFAHPVYAGGPRFTTGPSRSARHPGAPVSRGAWTWVRQQGKPQWFEEPIARCARELQSGAQAAMDDVARMLS